MSANLTIMVGWLRDADWLTRNRAIAYCRILFVVTFGLTLVWIALSTGGIDPSGKPLGTDFICFWTASKLALSGAPAEAYDIAFHHAEQTALFARDMGYTAFFYPPAFLLICLPLAALPYFWSLAAWLGVTGFAYWRVLRLWLGDRFGVLPILAFPAVLNNIGHGQNAFLSAALLGGGALMLSTRPIVAGVLLGALVFKPHLAIVIPVALIAARRWRTLAAAAASASAFCVLSLGVFGLQTWQAFLAASPKTRMALEQNLLGNEKMQSVFAAVRLLHGGLTLAYGLQILMILAVCAALVQLQRRSFRSDAEGPAMVAAALLASPFMFDYDLVLLAIPLAWLARQSLASGFLPWEKTVLAAGFIMPALSRAVAAHAGIPLGPITIVAIFLLVMRRAFAASHGRAPNQQQDRNGVLPLAATRTVQEDAQEDALSLVGER